MFTTETITELEQRKQALVIKSDVHRAMFELQIAQLRPYVERVDVGLHVFKKAGPLWTIVSPFLGLWVARRLRKVASWIPSAILGWKAVSKGVELWHSFQKNRTATAAAPMFPEQD